MNATRVPIFIIYWIVVFCALGGLLSAGEFVSIVNSRVFQSGTFYIFTLK